MGASQLVVVITSGRFLLNKTETGGMGTFTMTAAEAAPAIMGNAYRVPFWVPDTMAPVVWAMSMLWKKFFQFLKRHNVNKNLNICLV